MPNKFTLALIFSGILMVAHGQKKKDLIDEISQLKDSIASLNDTISKANRQIGVSDANAALFEKENIELREANATLLKNLSSFSQLSKQNSETVNKALATLKEKEAQLKFITDDFSQNDSTAIVILTQAKQTLGPEAKIGISSGDVILSNSLDFLFGGDAGTELTEEAATFLQKVGELIVANPSRTISVEGLNITGEFGLTYTQTLAVANALLNVEGISPEKIAILAKDGNFKEGINIRFAADNKAFYGKLKEEFK